MKRKQLKDNLHKLQDVRGNIRPRAEFVHETRQRLLNELSYDCEKRTSWFSMTHVWEGLTILVPNKAVYMVVRPMAVIGAVFVLATGSWITGAFASLNSAPGDTLYPVKITIEKTTAAVVGVTQGSAAKTQLKAEYAGRRLQEVKSIVNDETRQGDVKKAVERFKESINDVEQSLDELKDEDLAMAVELAKVVDEKTEMFGEVLNDTKESFDENTSEEVKESLKQAKTFAINMEVKTVEVFVKTLSTDTHGVDKVEVKEVLDKKLERMEKQALEVEAQEVKAEEVVLPGMTVENVEVKTQVEIDEQEQEEIDDVLEQANEFLLNTMEVVEIKVEAGKETEIQE